MLVLLIVFMISAPLLSSGVPVDLPESAAGELPSGNEPVTVTVNADGEIYILDDQVTINELIPAITAATEGNFEQRIFVRGDRASSYGAVMLVMGVLNDAGFSRIGLVTLPDQEN
ncbi:MAG: biopolymer transporter ExbD [Bauldia sp.]|nr:biopolymer transporter ExbD [Bauldia sp.]